MAKLSQLKTDKDKAENGVWVEWRCGIEFRIAQFANTRMQEFVRSKTKNSAFALSKKVADSVMSEEDLAEGLARFVLLDWKNVDDDNDEPLPYSPEVAKGYLADPDYDDMTKFIVEAARNFDVYKVEAAQEMEENS